MTEDVASPGPIERPSLGCRSCGASMPLARTVVLGNHERMLQCPSCGTITRWSLSAVHDLDLREAVDLRDKNVIDLDLDLEVEASEHHANGRRH